MELPDGTVAEVTALKLEGDTITVGLVIAWPGGHKAEAGASFTPSMTAQAWTVYAPGIADTRKPEPQAIDSKA